MRLPRSTHPLATRGNDAGRVDGSLAMKRMMLLLKASDQLRESFSENFSRTVGGVAKELADVKH